MTAHCKDETIYAEIENAISNISNIDLTQFDQDLRNQRLTGPPFNLSSSDLVRLLIFLESRFSVYIEYSLIENLGFNSVEEVKKVIEQSETIEQWEANRENYSTIQYACSK